MLEVSIHRNSKKVLDFKQKKSKKLFGMAGLLAIPTLEEVEKMTADYNSTLASFEKNIDGCFNSINEANRLIENYYEITHDTPKLDITKTNVFKEITSTKIHSAPSGANEQWIIDRLNTVDNRTLLDKAMNLVERLDKLCEDINWCISNPTHATYNFMVAIEPLLLTICLSIAGFGLVLYVITDEKFLGRKPTQFIKNPIIFYIAFKIIMYLLLSFV